MVRVAIGGAAAATTMEAETTASTTAMTSAGDEREDEETVFKCKKLKVCGVHTRKRPSCFCVLGKSLSGLVAACLQEFRRGTPARMSGEVSLQCPSSCVQGAKSRAAAGTLRVLSAVAWCLALGRECVRDNVLMENVFADCK